MNNSIQDQLQQHFSQALKAAIGSEVSDRDSIIVPASNPKFGDYQCNIALPLAKELKQKPREIAKKIIDHLDVSSLCKPPEIAGPGFINLTLKPSYLEEQLSAIQTDERLGVEEVKEPQREIVDFSSPNIAKEMHVGHLRSTIIGDAIARILEFRGQDVLRLNHVGDWGTQFGMLIAYLREAYPDALTTADALDLGDLVSFYKKAKARFDEDEQFKETARQEVVKLQAGTEETRRAWQLLCDQSRREFKVIYERLDIDLEERGESFYNPLLPNVVEALEKTGLIEKNQGAKCVFLDGFTNKSGEPLPLIVQKTDGGYNYATTDLAALRHRIQSEEAKRIIYVTDSGQANHFAQVFQVAKKAGWIPDDVEVVHVAFGLVLGEDGKKIKTRSGEIIRLRDLLDEAIARAYADLDTRLKEEKRTETEEFKRHVATVIGISAVKYADLSQNRNSNYIFSYNKMLALQGNTAPYLLYAYVRVQGISRKGKIDFEKLNNNAEILLKTEEELILAKHILQLSEAIAEVEKELLPNRLCQYLFELSQKYNQFFENCPVLKSEEPVRTSRLILCDLTARTLKLGLSLLGISVLERM
ncbi:MAG: arginine--tRNA ligase [Cyanobacteriota bacterium]|nr:arginine--tRNA ligase [Cyanobacteriota bacterium]